MSHKSVSVFWDYENCAPSCDIVGKATENIRRIALEHGEVKLFNAYAEVSDKIIPYAARCALQTYGVSLIDCPHRGQKDVVDKRMIVDMLQYALETPGLHTIILITGDHDFTSAVALLTLRMHEVVIIAPNALHGAPATKILDWSEAVLGKRMSLHQRAASWSSVGPMKMQPAPTKALRRASVSTGAGRGLSPLRKGPLEHCALLQVPPQTHLASPKPRTILHLKTDAVTLSARHPAKDGSSNGDTEPPERPCAPDHPMSNLPSPFDSELSLSPIDSCGLGTSLFPTPNGSRCGSRGDTSEGDVGVTVPIGAEGGEREWASRVKFGSDTSSSADSPPTASSSSSSGLGTVRGGGANVSPSTLASQSAAPITVDISDGRSLPSLTLGSTLDAQEEDTLGPHSPQAETRIVVTAPPAETSEANIEPFHILINILDRARSDDPDQDRWLRRSKLGSELINLYGKDWRERHTKSSSFRDYMNKAEEQGIVILSDSSVESGHEWVRLSANWHGRGNL